MVECCKGAELQSARGVRGEAAALTEEDEVELDLVRGPRLWVSRPRATLPYISLVCSATCGLWAALRSISASKRLENREGGCDLPRRSCSAEDKNGFPPGFISGGLREVFGGESHRDAWSKEARLLYRT